MAISTVKWFDQKKGYGFIINPYGGEDIFVHFSAIASGNSFKSLTPQQEVDFEVEPTAKGLQARNVRRLANGLPLESGELSYGDAQLAEAS